MTTLKKEDLLPFIGSEVFYRHWAKLVIYTEGVKFLADKAHAYWLIDHIAIHQMVPKIHDLEFQNWKLVVDLLTHRGTITVDDGNGNIAEIEDINWTDFPLEEITLFYTGRTLMLPSEY